MTTVDTANRISVELARRGCVLDAAPFARSVVIEALKEMPVVPFGVSPRLQAVAQHMARAVCADARSMPRQPIQHAQPNRR